MESQLVLCRRVSPLETMTISSHPSPTTRLTPPRRPGLTSDSPISLLLHAGGATAGLAAATFAHFHHVPKSCSAADFGSVARSSSHGRPTAGGGDVSPALADRYAALAHLDGVFSSANPEPGKPPHTKRLSERRRQRPVARRLDRFTPGSARSRCNPGSLV